MSINTLKTRLNYAGGDANGRIKQQKLRSFKAALLNDYNSRLIQTEDGCVTRCLMNLNNLKPDYDKKYISVEHSAGLESGDTYEVLDDHTHWMIYLPDLAETAYLRSEIIRCRYTLNIDGKDYWVYFQGPTETDIRWSLSHGFEINELNLSGTIYVKNNPNTKAYFSRFKKFKIAEHTWEAQVVDYISVPGIIEIEVQEYFDDPIADLPEIIMEPPAEYEDEIISSVIVGSTEVKPGATIGYSIPQDFYMAGNKWYVDGNEDVAIAEILNDGLVCSVKINEFAYGDFSVIYGNEKLDVHIDTITSDIKGDTIVYPYSVHDYSILNVSGEFVITSPLARIIEQGNQTCKVEIVSGRSGSFTLYYIEYGSNEQYELPIKIKSL